MLLENLQQLKGQLEAKMEQSKKRNNAQYVRLESVESKHAQVETRLANISTGQTRMQTQIDTCITGKTNLGQQIAVFNDRCTLPVCSSFNNYCGLAQRCDMHFCEWARLFGAGFPP